MSLTFPTVTGYSAFWQTTGDMQPYSMTPRSQHGSRHPLERSIAKMLNRPGLRDLKEAMLTLNGAAVGEAALATYLQISAPSGPEATTPVVTTIGDFGGLRTIDTITVIDRITTTADKNYVDDLLNGDLLTREIQTQGYPTVVGSGGGGKVSGGVVSF